MDAIGAGWAQAPAGTGEAAHAFRGAILAGAGSAFVLFLLLGPPPRRSYGPEAVARPAEIDAAVAAWVAEAERGPVGGRGWGRPADRGARTPARPPAEAGRRAAARGPDAGAAAAAGAPAAGDGRIDLNRASAGQIDAAVPGFGEILSARLVAARPPEGWRDWGQVEGVPGIGRRRIDALRLYSRL